ncbi:DUF2235 domain-containing protein [Pedobacter mendelii]|uniref:T6SS Phospholipase effector Tle1-like catalytic domain-containing protein n=1 Tax=Pedobacter mendelii TaxID=1908240 RepID=A0ABQ2BG08_9SPHI|nr:DUF2235 domain-containing protein [Pedobacter mendelii]GGI23595.1 hypothetical protein GCM10008119_08430 [Pedobacter mendelii]
MKRIIVCCDGTWNSPGDTEDGEPIKTNVQKLFESVCNVDEKGVIQIKHYIEGVGTSGSRFRQILDGATGRGLDHNILSAYKFLVWNYIKGDEIYLFGFSRGAYTARSVAGLIRNCGIIRNDDLGLINEAYHHYRNRKDPGWAPNGKNATDFRKKYSTESIIKFIGVWDTVGSLGIPLSIFRIFNSNKYKFHDTTLSSFVDYAYHGLAIDERRKSFKPTLWNESRYASSRKVPQIMEQRWFTGVHSSVGGGYPDARLSDIALSWMLEKAMDTDLGIDKKYVSDYLSQSIDGKIYNSFVFPFNCFGPLKRIISSRNEYNASIDPTAIKRWNRDERYRPENLRHVVEQIEKTGKWPK